MRKILYLDLVGGIAGDMFVASLLNLGVPLSVLEQGFSQLKSPGFQFTIQSSQRHHISGTQFAVESDESAKMDHVHRSFRKIRQLICDSKLSPNVQSLALRVFERLAAAEGKIHNTSPENVTFHEVGAWDSIADIVGAALCLDYLQIHDIFASVVPVGTGFVMTAHGRMPIPAPATLELLKGFHILNDSLPYERTTPTGAALLAALAKPSPPLLTYQVENVGIGVGNQKREEVPNILRSILGLVSDIDFSASDTEMPSEQVECSEANIDDCSSEWLGYVHERLLTLGALDVWFVPIQMKKSRPGVILQVLHTPELRQHVHHLLLSETTTLGVRYHTLQRNTLKRNIVEVSTQWGVVKGKKAEIGGVLKFSPEFEDCREIALNQDIPIQTVYRVVEKNFWQSIQPTEP